MGKKFDFFQVYKTEWFRKEAVDYAKERVRQRDTYIISSLPGNGLTTLLSFLEDDLNKIPAMKAVLVDFNELVETNSQAALELLSRKLTDLWSDGQEKDLLSACEKLARQDLTAVMLIDRFDKLIKDLPDSFFDYLRAMVIKSHRKLVLVFGLGKPLSSVAKLAHIDQLLTLAGGNVYQLPLMTQKESEFYIRLRAERDDLSIDEKQVKQIYGYTDGHMRLISSFIDYIVAQHPQLKQSVSQLAVEFMQTAVFDFHCLRLINSLDENQSQWIKNVAEGKSPENQSAESYFTRIGLVKDKQLTSGFLQSYLLGVKIPRKKGLLHDQESGEIYLDGERIDTQLSPSEYRFLQYLLTHINQVVTRDDLIEYVWGEGTREGVSDDAVDQLVGRVREKIKEDKTHPQRLITIRGRGFQLKMS